MAKKRGKNIYNKEYGYLRTLFSENREYIAQACEAGFDRGTLNVSCRTNRGRIVFATFSLVGESAFRVRLSHASGCSGNTLVDPAASNALYRNDEESFCLDSGVLRLVIDKNPWCVHASYRGREIIREQIADTNVDNMCKLLPAGFDIEDGKCVRTRESFVMRSDESYYGFGEKFTEFNKRGQLIDITQCDALSTNTGKSYKNHPFFISSRGYGLFVNSYTTMRFDMGASSNVSYQIEIDEDVLDYIVFAGDDDKHILKSYLDLFGPVPRLPSWAFGVWMSKCSYQSRKEVEDVVAQAMDRGIRFDVVHIDNWQDPEYAGLWVWNEKAFPDPKGMIEGLNEKGVRLSIWIYPYLSERSPAFKEMAEKGFFVKNRDGGPAMFSPMATVDYLTACFDFTNPEFVNWYRKRIRKVMDMGVSVIKTDFSEAVPLDAVYCDGSSGRQGHNKLTFLYAKTIYDEFKESCEARNEIPMLWGRSGYSGSHTIPAAWAGDSSSSLNNHSCILRGGLSGAESGIPFWGFDLGGFYNTDEEGYECVPSDEEYVRSFEMGLLCPLSRFHGKTDREPWKYSKAVQETFMKFYNLRRALHPYLCSEAAETSASSIPMLRPLRMEHPKDIGARDIELEYHLGTSLLVAPVFDQDPFLFYLPEGRWKDFFTLETLDGGWHERKCALDEIPLFIRENSVIAMNDDRGLGIRAYVNKDFEASVNTEDGPSEIRARVRDNIVDVEHDDKIKWVEILTDL